MRSSMDELFNLFDPENEDLVRDINETVNHAIDTALRTGIKEAAANVKISIEMYVNSDGFVVPVFKYKTKVNVGMTIPMKGGKRESALALYKEDGRFWRTTKLAEQTRIEGA